MGLGLGVLRYSPDVFWKMTLAELAAAVSGMVPIEDGIDRAQLASLMQRYPDR
jgi:uncharacterized phage protein (TIGR02216 family)